MREKLIKELKEDKTEFDEFILITDQYVQSSTKGKVGLMTLLGACLDNCLENGKLEEKDIDYLVKVVKSTQTEEGMLKLLKEMLKNAKKKLED